MVRVRPLDLEVPADDPFAHDLLSRREPIDVLTHLIRGIEGPCVLAVDSPWGTGKTSFLRLWAQHLRNEGFRVVDFNAWETDFAGEPFVALSTELTNGLDASPFTQKVKATRDAAGEVLKRAIPGLIKVGTAGVLDVSPLLEDRLTQYESGRKSIDEFRAALEGLAADVAKENENLPLVVMIDELDRCRPSYAVELLEVAKHLFSVDGIIFVLSLDRAELAHSVRSIYGNEFGASGYLRRFFDIDYRLPDPDIGAFVDAAFDSIGLDAFYARTKDQEARSLSRQLSELMKRFFGTLDVSLRDVGQAVHRLGLVLASLPDNKKMFGLTAGVLLVLRAWRPELYRGFVDGRTSAGEVVDEVFSQPGMREVRGEKHVNRLFEAVIIVCELEQKGESDLLVRYRELVKRDIAEGDPEVSARDHAREVLGIVNSWGARAAEGGVGLKYTVSRLELLSAELRDDASANS